MKKTLGTYILGSYPLWFVLWLFRLFRDPWLFSPLKESVVEMIGAVIYTVSAAKNADGGLGLGSGQYH